MQKRPYTVWSHNQSQSLYRFPIFSVFKSSVAIYNDIGMLQDYQAEGIWRFKESGYAKNSSHFSKNKPCVFISSTKCITAQKLGTSYDSWTFSVSLPQMCQICHPKMQDEVAYSKLKYLP